MAYAFNEDKSKAEVFTKEEIFNVIYPVGSIYMSANNVNPATLFGGTWQKIEGRFMLASGSGYNLGGTGGSANATIPSHTHNVTGTVANNGSHKHNGSTTLEAGYHTHKYESSEITTRNARAMLYFTGYEVGRRQVATSSTSEVYAWASSPDYASSSTTLTMSDHTSGDGQHNHAVSLQTDGNHNHSFNVTSGSTGSSATGANMPPYLVVNVWKRTA